MQDTDTEREKKSTRQKKKNKQVLYHRTQRVSKLKDSKGGGQQLNVQMEASDEWSPSRVLTGTGAVQYIYQ